MLTKNWFLTHTPAPGSFREYASHRPIADTDEVLGDVSHVGGSKDVGESLRSIHGAMAREQRRLERAFA